MVDFDFLFSLLITKSTCILTIAYSIVTQMNPSDTKKSTCRSRESLKRRRKQCKQEIKRDTSATGSCGG